MKTYIKDDWDFVKKLPGKIPFKCRLFSCDIPTNLGIKAIRYWIERRRDLIPERFTSDFILESLEFILTNNNFLFNDEMFHQEEGTAMGTIVAPPYACCVIGYLEEAIYIAAAYWPKYSSI